MIDGLFVIFIIACWVCFCVYKCHKKRDDESEAHGDLPAFRQTMSERRRQATAPQPSAPPQDPQDRESQIKSVLFSRTLEANESVSSLRSVLSATKEEFNETSRGTGGSDGSQSGGGFMSRSWRAAKHSVRTLSREECSICLDKYDKGDTVCWSKKEECDHIFHEDCISTWLNGHDECPLCRSNLFEGVKDEEEENGDIERNTNEE
uniref:RING-type domain-containing protein n=1 Tax=Odontella aurita TaxID=265563 RepID=A0A7S4JGB2_9STRA|mmetsp:Transcript_46062/g.139799  ORF Transcript_46062/g.139799 Transcript_46062/m.139799 type:complete len:206 (+) Transcript_46062:100-717(+)